MSRTKKFLLNSFTTAFFQVIVMIAGFITPRIMLNSYGSEINGLISSLNQFIVYFNLVEAGLSGAAIYALYKPLAEKDYKAINGVVSAAKTFYLQSGYIFVSLTVGLACLYPLFVKSDSATPITVGLLVLILGVNGSLEFVTLAKYRVLLTANQQTYIISIASVIEVVVNTLIIVILASLKVDIVVLRFVALFSIFIRSFLLMFYVKRKYKFINYNEVPNFNALNKRWDALYLQLLGAIQTGAPIVIITLVINNLKIVSVYAIYNMFIVGINGVLSIFISGLAASFGEIIAKDELKTLQKAYSEFEFLYYSLITIVYGVTFVTIMPIIRFYTEGITDINYNLPIFGFLFVLNGLLYNIKTPQGMLVNSAGLYKETRVQTTIQGLITIILGVVLTPFLGISGVLIGSIISNLYRDIDLMFFIPRNITQLTVKTTFKRILTICISLVIICSPFMILKYNPSSIFSLLAYILVVGIFSLIIVFLNGYLFDRHEMENTIKRILSMVRRI